MTDTYYIVEYNGCTLPFNSYNEAYDQAKFYRNTYRTSVRLYRAEIINSFESTTSDDVELFSCRLKETLEEAYQQFKKLGVSQFTLPEDTTWDIHYKEITSIVYEFFAEKQIEKQDLDIDINEKSLEVFIWDEKNRDFNFMFNVEWYSV